MKLVKSRSKRITKRRTRRYRGGGIRCPICNEPISEDESSVLYEANCGHIFHINCLSDECSKDKNTCPECKKNIKLDCDKLKPVSTREPTPELETRTIEAEVVKIKVNGKLKKFAFEKTTGNLYDLKLYERSIPELVGTLKKVHGKWKYEPIIP